MSLAMFSLKIEPGPRFEAFLIYFFNQSNVFGRMSFLINGFTTKKILPSSSPSPPSSVPPPSSYIPSKSSPPSWHEEEDFWALYNQTDLAIIIATLLMCFIKILSMPQMPVFPLGGGLLGLVQPHRAC